MRAIGLAWLSISGFAIGCCGDPTLSKQEAVSRATEYVDRMGRDYMLFSEKPRLVEDQFDKDKKWWSLTFESGECKIIIITDRCGGTEVGGLNAACKQK